MFTHVPVLLNEVIDSLDINPDGIYVDLTIGRAGHSSEILKRLSSKGMLIGFDQDETAIKESSERLSKISKSFLLIRDNFKNFKENLEKNNISKVDGILADLGVSSPQFDDEDRGFSYQGHSVLDMRMDQRNELTARYIVNNYSLNDLTRIFRDYGEDKFSFQIAKKIVDRRAKNEIVYTDELVDIIKSAKPMKELNKKGHPAKQIFQALRIEVNHELEVLKIALEDAISLLKDGGRLSVITFHSLEDRIVKEIFKKYCVIEGDRKNSYLLPSQIKQPDYELVNRHPIVASEEELEKNNRSHSAKLRVIRKKEKQDYDER